MRLFSLAVALATLSGKVSAVVVGPNAYFPIQNGDIAPDGYNRSWVTCGWHYLKITLALYLSQCHPRSWYLPRPTHCGTKGSYPLRAVPSTSL